MRIAVISDVHSNLHALQAVLAAVDADSADQIWCLGDVVGYGPRPNECCALVRERASLCLAGNHDLGVIGTIDLALFAGEAGAAARWTRAALSDDARGFLSDLQPAGRADGVELYHASPRDPVWEYVLGPEQALASFAATSAPLVLIGHSHFPLALSLEGMRVLGGSAAPEDEADLAEGRWLLNPGSVGQPRDGDPRAAWLLLDTGSQRASFRRVEYPVALTQAEMRAGGLPEGLAARLTHGV